LWRGAIAKRKESLDPDERARRFQLEIQRLRNGEEAELEGFFIARKPPYAPGDAAYYLLSPLPPGELRIWRKPKPYVVLRITESSRVDSVTSGAYVRVRGVNLLHIATMYHRHEYFEKMSNNPKDN
jgi:hypothetical protein